PSAERIAQLFAPVEAGDGAAFVNLLSPNVTWTLTGSVLGGTHNFTETLGLISSITSAINGTYTAEVVSVISEGAEGRFSSTELRTPKGMVGKNGVQYEQRYAWVTEWDCEKIVANHEYLDSALVDRLLA
ncbi:hypothetical protein PQX77_022144, partial [Marasmius sp. AFHP31]